ncbi:MAG: flagellar basal body rod protein FlgB [Sphingomonadaceae bacterium]
MAQGPLLDLTGRLLQESLSGLTKRQQLISNNLANMDTPGYRALEIPFEQVLDREMRKEGQLAMAATSPAHFRSPDTMEQALSMQQTAVFRTDRNGVDVDAEMARLAETTIEFTALTQLMAGRLALLRTAITEGRR